MIRRAVRAIRRAVPAPALALAHVVVTGCALARPALPAPEAGFARYALAGADANCRDRGCTHVVRVGEVEHEVESDVTLMTAAEATDAPAPGAGREVLGAAGRELLRGIGFETTELMVGAGIRGVSDPEGLLNLVCDVAWIDEITTTRVDREDELSSERLVDGHDCTAGSPEDTLPAWHFRAGLAPDRDGLRRALDSLARRPGREPADVVPMALVRQPDADAAQRRYTMELASRTAVLPRFTWVVRRPDGTIVGALLRSGREGMHAVDIARDADAGEATVLRLIGAMLAVPLAR